VFTKDGNGLVFWGGFSSYAAASTTPASQYSHMLAGTLYGADLSQANSIQGITVTSLLPTAEGGSADGVRSYSVESPFAPALPAGAWSAAAGVVKPYGGFLSLNREFLYLVNKGGLADGSAEYRLVGTNVRSVDTARSVNGHADFRSFAVGGWPARRGFLSGTWGTQAQYGLRLTDYPAYRKWGMGLQVAAGRTGRVYFASHHQSSGPAVGTGNSTSGGPIRSTWSDDRASFGGEVEGFDADAGGPVERLTDFGDDTAVRRIHFLETRAGGGEVAFVLDAYGTANASAADERLHAVTGIRFGGAGTLDATPRRHAVEPLGGRISDAVALGTAGDRLYYGAGDASDEATMVLKEARLGPGGVTTRTLVASQRRWNVLHAGR
jgi:hypothetical protein